MNQPDSPVNWLEFWNESEFRLDQAVVPAAAPPPQQAQQLGGGGAAELGGVGGPQQQQQTINPAAAAAAAGGVSMLPTHTGLPQHQALDPYGLAAAQQAVDRGHHQPYQVGE